MIKVQDLHYTYPNNKDETIKGLDFEVAEGEIFGFLGPSGAGKSTVQKIIIGILKNYNGTIDVMGKNLKNQKSDYYENIGISFEFPNLYTRLTARENLEFFAAMYGDAGGASADTQATIDLLNMVGLNGDIDKRVENFSKGMRMRLNFCRAFINKPKLLFLDEPTSGQDPNNARRIKDIILEKKSQGKTIFLTTHDMHVATELCNRVAFIVDGNISLIDSPRDLMVARSKRAVIVEYIEKGKSNSQTFELDGLGTNKDFQAVIKKHKIERIHSQEATLEDIFIDVTGKSLSEVD